LIRDGAVVKTFEVVSPFEIAYSESDLPDVRKSYYRLEVQAKDFMLISNPVFIKRQIP